MLPGGAHRVPSPPRSPLDLTPVTRGKGGGRRSDPRHSDENLQGELLLGDLALAPSAQARTPAAWWSCPANVLVVA